MSEFSHRLAHVTHFICQLRGKSRPMLAEASDGLLYVVKMATSSQVQNLCFNESLGNELYRACRLPVAPWKPLLLTDSFIERNPICWIETPQGYRRPDAGLSFGSLFLGQKDARLLEILPASYFDRIQNRADFWAAWLLDIRADHAGHREAIFMETRYNFLKAHFIDHGRLFMDSTGDCPNGLLNCMYLDDRVYGTIAPNRLECVVERLIRLRSDDLWGLLGELPHEWLSRAAIDAYYRALTRLANRDFLLNVINSLLLLHPPKPQSALRMWDLPITETNGAFHSINVRGL